MFHDARDIDVGPVTDGIDFNLDARQVAVDEDGTVFRGDDGVAHIPFELRALINDFHRPAAEDV